MTTVYVTKSEHMAAQALVERAERFGRKVEPWVAAIARARPARRDEAAARDVVEV